MTCFADGPCWASEEPVKLSILICSIPRRLHQLAILLQELDRQVSLLPTETVEVLALTDAQRLILGDKRNRLVRAASGDYVAFVDDDDWVAPDYLATLLALLRHEPDVVTFPVSVTLDDGTPKPCYYSIHYPDQGECESHYWRWPNHLCVIRRELVRQQPFPSLQFGEDTAFAQSIRPILKTQLNFDRHPLYYYRYYSEKTE